MVKQTEEVSLKLEEELGVDHSWSGITCDGIAGETLSFGYLCYKKSDGKWWKASADAPETTNGHLALALADGGFLLMGYLRDDSWNWAVGAWLYVHTNLGEMVQIAPSGSSKQIREIGAAPSSNIVWFAPSLTVLELT